MLLTNWLKSLTSRYRTVRSRRPRNQRSRSRHRYQPALSRRPIAIEELEDRTLLTSLISIDDESVWEDTSLGMVQFTITRRGENLGDLNSELIINYSTQDGTATVADNDYDSASGTIRFFANPNTVKQTNTVFVRLNDDSITEGNESFQLVLTTEAQDAIIVRDTGTAKIYNDDRNSLSINDVTALENDTFVFEVSLDHAAGTDITFLATTENGTASNIYDRDFTTQSNMPYTIKAGELTTEITVYVHDDDSRETDETFFVKLSARENNSYEFPSYLTFSDDTGQGTILNDDGLPGSTFRLDSSKVIEGNDGTQILIYDVVRTGQSAGDLNFDSTVEFRTLDGTATAGEDYSDRWTTVIFSASATETEQIISVEVPILGDAKKELSETIIGQLSNPTNGSILKGNVDTLLATGIIINDDTDLIYQQAYTPGPLHANHTNEYAGRIIAVDDDVMVIGVPYGETNEVRNSGAVYVYVKNQQNTPLDQSDDTWEYETVLVPDDPGEYANFGSSVAINNDTIVVGATGNERSKIYIFTKVGSDWKSTAPILNSFMVEGLTDSFNSSEIGRYLSIYDNTIVVGAPDYDAGNGAVFVFENSENDWSAPTISLLSPTVSSSTDQYGFEVSISGDLIVVGAYLDSELDPSRGSAYVYTKNGDDWSTIPPTEAKLTSTDGKGFDWFGYSVSTNGTEVAIGAKYTDDNGSLSGSVYLYSRNGDDWTSTAPNEIELTGYAQWDKFGDTVILSENELFVGAFEDDTAGYLKGAVYIYSKTGDIWDLNTLEESVLVLPDEEYTSIGRFGEGIAYSNGNLITGAPWVDILGNRSGGIFTYYQNGASTWVPGFEFSPDSALTKQNEYEAYGNVVAVSGNYMIISAAGTDSNLAPTGAVYVYRKNDSGTPLFSSDDTWELETTFAAPDQERIIDFGQSVAIDGTTIIVSARLDDGTGEIYIYERNGSDWVSIPPSMTALYSHVNSSIIWQTSPYHSPIFVKQSIAIQDDTIVIGSRNGVTYPGYQGVVYVYTRNGANWADQIPTESVLTASDGEVDDSFGYAVDIDGDKIVIGAFDDTARRGIAYLYIKGSLGWDNATEIKLIGHDTQVQDRFGTSVAIDGNTIAIGAPFANEAGTHAGAVYIFDGTHGWDNPEEYKFTPQDSDVTKQRMYGASISLRNNQLAVGFANELDNYLYTSSGTGSVYLYDGSAGWDPNNETIITAATIPKVSYGGFGTNVTLDDDGNLLLTELYEAISISNYNIVHSFVRPYFDERIETDTLIPPAPLTNEDHIGNAIEVSGDYMVVGAIHSDIAATDGGAAYVYIRNRQGTPDNESDDTWDYHSTLTAFDAEAGDQFGTSIAIDGDTIVIGSLLDDDQGDDSGSAYVYRLVDNVWSLEEKLTATDGREGDQFGISVSIEDSTIVVGARYHNYFISAFDDHTGAAYVFDRSGTDWTQTQKLTASNHSDQDAFGHDVLIKNDAIYITGLRAAVDDSPSGTGAIYIFHNQDGAWTEQQIIGPPDGEYDDWFGYDIHVDGNFLGAVSAADDEFKGSVYLFKNNAGTWEFQQKLTPPVGNQLDRSAFSIRISGTTIAIGSLLSDGQTTDSGAVFLYQLISGDWVESQTISALDGAEQDYFGHAVAFSGDQIIVGAPQNDEAGNNVGKVYVFRTFAPQINIIPTSQKEGDQGETIFTFEVERVGQSSGDLDFESTIDFETVDFSATLADHDYEFQSGTITFTADPNAIRQTQTIEITVYGDDIFEGDEKFVVRLSNPSDGTILGSNSVFGWIEEDDHAELGIENTTVNESAGTVSITVSLDKPAIGRVSVMYSTADQTADSPADYTSSTGTITFEPGELSKTIQVPINDNAIVEGNEIFLVNLTDLVAEGSDVIISQGQAEVTIEDDDEATISIDDVSVDESAGTVNLIVTLSQASENTVTVDFRPINQTATKPADYLDHTGTLSFSPGELTQTITFSIVDSDLVERDEQFLVLLSNIQAGGGNVTFARDRAQVTILNDDQASMTVDDVTVDEDTGTVELTVSLDHTVDTTISVEYATADLSAIAGDDYTPQTGTLTFSPFTLTRTISIPIVNSDLVELEKSFFVNLSNLLANGRDVILADSQAEVTISDDDQALVTIDDITVNEADGTAEVTVSLDKPVASEISVDYTTAGQSALDTEDFESQSGTLTFTVGQQTRIISIPLVNNEDLELDESFSIMLSDLQNHGFNVVLADAQAEVTIEDDEQALFSIADIDVNEADGTAVLTVTLDTPLPVTVTVDFSTSNLTAVSPDDYQSTSGTLTFLPGELSQTITIDIVDSDLLEIDETFLVTLSNLQSGNANVILGDSQAEVTIHDDDQASLTIDDVTVDENAGAVLLTVSLNQAAGDTISIDYTTADQSAVADDDYASQTGTLTFAPGVLTQTISIPIVDSDLVELEESFLVNLSNLQTNGWNVSLTDAQAVVTISDDDQAQLTIDDISINESEGTAEVTVSLDQPVAGEISVHFETADQTAIVGEDYEGQSGTITFSTGQQTRIISIPLIDTNLVEPDEQFLINLSQLQNNGYDVVLADAQAEVTIRDDDQAQFTIDDIIVSEADGTAVLTVSLSHPVTSTVTIDYATADDSALSPEDYQAQTGTLTFLPDVQSQSITIDLINSALIELDERFLVNLSNIQAGSADVVIGDHQGEVTIQDNEQAQLIVSDLTVNEADGTAEVVVTLDQPVSFEVRVNYSLADGKAKNSLDYQSQSGTLIFAPGEQSKTITVALIDNDKVEEIEDFHVNLSGLNIQSDVVIIGRSQADVSIVDDDQAQFSITDITVDEAAGVARLYIYLTDTVYANISVDYSTVDQSAVSDSDYLAKSGRLTFTQGQTAKSLTITITNDQIVEGLESFYVQLSNIQANGAQLTFANDSGEVTIEDNDEANLTMSDVTVDESAGVALVSLTLDQPVEAAVSLDFNTLDQSARANSDYQTTAGTVTFQPGEVSQTVSIPLIDTDLVELTESFLVQFTNLQAGGANIALSRNRSEVTVTDDDQSNITIDDISVDESAANVQVTVSLDAPVDASVVINYATASQTAQSPSDYAHRSGSLTFTPGTQTQTISIPIVDSGLLEIDETFLVILSGLQANGHNVILADDRAVVTILDDDSASAEVNLRVVSSPTPTQPDGSIIQLPEHEAWVSEWATWWIEIWVQTNDQTSQGSISVDVDLSYNSAVASAMEIEYGPRFSTNQTGDIDDSTGTITDLHAETSTAGLQVNRRTLFARIRFTPQLQDQIDLDLSEKVLPAEDLELQANSVEVQLSNAAPFVTPIEAIPAVQIYANPYDLNNDDAINFRDLLLFASVYNSTPSQSDSDYAWFADLNQDDRVNFRDLLLFASNYGKSKANHSIVTYPSNFPDAWNQLLVADTSSAPQQTATPLTQTVATASFSRIVDQVSGSLSEEQNVMLETTTVQVVDLEGDALGRVAGGTIYIDVDAAGYGWYLEGSPAADFNFVYDSDLSLIALPGSDADGRFDLQTVLFHELGHLLGYEHSEDGVMQDTLAPGIRLLPDWELNFEFDPGLSLEDTDEFFLDIQDETELMPFK